MNGPPSGAHRPATHASVGDPGFEAWLDALAERHLCDLSFAEVRRGVQALSHLYVQRRDRLSSGAAFEGAGKRAAFALFYAPLHFLLARHIIRELQAGGPGLRRILDLGCGTAPVGAAWASEAGDGVSVEGVDASGWAVREARWNLATLGLRGTARRGDVRRQRLPGAHSAVVLAYVVNEMDAQSGSALLRGLCQARERGARVLVIEPIARRPVSWWQSWTAVFCAAGGREDIWRVRFQLPERLRLLDKAAGLDHGELSGRSLFM